MTTLLLAKFSWVCDVLFFVLIFLGIFLGVRRGLVKGVMKWAGTILSGIVALIFCVSLQALFNKWFGASDAINRSLHSNNAGNWIMTIICFILIFVLVKLGCWLIGKLLSGAVNSVKPLRIVNMALGGVLGAFEALLLIFGLLFIFSWIPSDGLHNFIGESMVVGKLFSSDWFVYATRFRFSKIIP